MGGSCFILLILFLAGIFFGANKLWCLVKFGLVGYSYIVNSYHTWFYVGWSGSFFGDGLWV